MQMNLTAVRQLVETQLPGWKIDRYFEADKDGYQTVWVKPKQGGPSKVAQIQDGKVQIIQG